jgi:hypothetical protein
LTNSADAVKNVQVIWYELPPSDDPIEAFTQLNVGKIPLTNAELIRALFIRERNFDPQSIEGLRSKIAQEWDAIESGLQGADMWHFLTDGRENPASRIDLIFKHIIALP